MGAKQLHRMTDSTTVQIWSLFFLPCFLLLCGEEGFTTISAFKTVLFYGLCAILGVLAAINCVTLLIRCNRRGSSRGLVPETARMSLAHWAALAYLVFTLLSAAFSPYGNQAWYSSRLHEAALTQALYVLVFLTVSAWAKPDKALSWVFHLALAVLCGISLLQLLGANPFGLYPGFQNYYDYSEAHRFLGTIGNPDLVSALLCLCVPICVVSAITGRGIGRLPGVLLGLLSLGIMLWIRVLCGLVGLAVGGLVCAFVLIPAKPRTKRLCFGVLVLLAAGALFYLYSHPTSIQPLQELHAMLHGRFEDSFGTGRVFIWRQMLERIPGQLWLGSGPDTVALTNLQPFVTYVPGVAEPRVAGLTDAHCLPLHILYCQGLPALLAWLVMVGAVLIPWLRTRHTAAEAALGAGMVCFLAAMLFCFSSIIIMPFFWFGLGMLHGSQRAGWPRPAKQNSRNRR